MVEISCFHQKSHILCESAVLLLKITKEFTRLEPSFKKAKVPSSVLSSPIRHLIGLVGQAEEVQKYTLLRGVSTKKLETGLIFNSLETFRQKVLEQAYSNFLKMMKQHVRSFAIRWKKVDSTLCKSSYVFLAASNTQSSLSWIVRFLYHWNSFHAFHRSICSSAWKDSNVKWW